MQTTTSIYLEYKPMDANPNKVVLVKDTNPGGDDSELTEFIEFNNKLYFTADNGDTSTLWVSDGTTAGTQPVADFLPNEYFSSFLFDRNFVEFNDKLYFRADNGENGRELWVSDGTTEGTKLFADINPGEEGSSIESFTKFNNKLYFTADNGENGRELWVSDGTTEGTKLFADLNPGVEGSNPSDFFEFENKLYFSADDGENGWQIWVSDGTTEGTKLFADMGFESSPDNNYYASYPSDFVEVNDKLYFSAVTGREGRSGLFLRQLFVSDGTVEGTKTINFDLGRDSRFIPYPVDPRNLIEFNDKLYFNSRFLGRQIPNTGNLFISDGTVEGTQGANTSELLSSSNDSPIEFNDKLYFSAFKFGGRELYVSDGTVEGTKLLADLNPGEYDSDPGNFVEFNDRLYFTARNSEGRNLYVSDGTTEGTQLVADLLTSDSENYRSPYNLTVIEDELFFSAFNDEVGTELFKLTIDRSETQIQTQLLNPILGTTNDDNLIGTDGDDEMRDDASNDGLTGSSGNDVLEGRLGNDALDGGAGNDTLDGGGGTDTAVYQFAPATVTVILGDEAGTASDGYGGTDSLTNLENVIGSEFDDNLTGNSGNNSLTGRGGNDAIAGLSGDDSITGSEGADTLVGGAGNDWFIYLNPAEGGDNITDFTVGTDKIQVLSAVFGGGLSSGQLPESRFAIGSAATSSDQRFVFDESSSELFFDVDGSDSSPQQLIATLDGVSHISAGDITLL